MEYEIKLCQVTPSYMAAVRTIANAQNLAAKIRSILTESKVYEFIKDNGLEKAGHNVFIYRDAENEATPLAPGEFILEIGVQVAQPFTGDGRVICTTTPHGTAATVLHVGPYDRLGKAHNAVRSWCLANGHQLTKVSWEIYGDWEEDPNKLCTEVFYLLK